MRDAGNATGYSKGLVVLSGLQPLTGGANRLVFQHPGHPELLIKVNKDWVLQTYGPRGSFLKRNYHCGQYTMFLREIQEYLAACNQSAHSPLHLAEIVGLLHTDLGLGLVVRKVCGPDGQLAPTLAKLIQQGALDEARLQLLETFLEWLQGTWIVVNDLSLKNIVLGVDDEGAERFLLVDGIGCSTFIPLKALVREACDWSKRGYIQRLRAQIAEAVRIERGHSNGG